MTKQFKLERLVAGEWRDYATDRVNGEWIRRPLRSGTYAEIAAELADREKTLPEYTYRMVRA